MKGRGLFITLEGGEGVGKSTSRAFLHEFLSSRGVDLVETREPGGTSLGEEIRDLLLQVRDEPMAMNTELLLIFAARAQHIAERIEPALAAGKWVLCDRFTDATIAYQCGGRGVATTAVRCLEELVQGELRPDYTLLLDADIATGMERARERGELDRIEQETLEFFERVRASYLKQARNSSGRYRLINADQPLAQVQATLAEIGHELIAAWKVRQGNT